MPSGWFTNLEWTTETPYSTSYLMVSSWIELWAIMNQSRGGGFVSILLAFAAFIVALLAWLAPFSPVGPSPFAPDDNDPTVSDSPIEPASANVPVPTAEQSSAPTSESVTITLPQAGDIRTVMRGGIAVEQVFVPAGSFMMGSEDGEQDERPMHEVTLDSFWLDRTEVTNAQFAAFVAATGYETMAEREAYPYDWRHPPWTGSDLSGIDEHPVVTVSWEDAVAYAEWAGGRLPTEAEWEYAARGPESLVYPWGNTFDGEKLNFCDRNCPSNLDDQNVDDGYIFTAPVGMYPNGASWVGALDMAGNVYEWVNDWYDSDYYRNSPEENPMGPAPGIARVLRGSSWIDYDRVTRAAHRDGYTPAYRNLNVGFRVVELLSDSDS